MDLYTVLQKLLGLEGRDIYDVSAYIGIDDNGIPVLGGWILKTEDDPKVEGTFKYINGRWVKQHDGDEDEIPIPEQQKEKWSWEEEIPKLHVTCTKISGLCDETKGGTLMWSQLSFLGELIKDFLNNPIVKFSGIKEGN